MYSNMKLDKNILYMHSGMICNTTQTGVNLASHCIFCTSVSHGISCRSVFYEAVAFAPQGVGGVMRCQRQDCSSLIQVVQVALSLHIW